MRAQSRLWLRPCIFSASHLVALFLQLPHWPAGGRPRVFALPVGRPSRELSQGDEATPSARGGPDDIYQPDIRRATMQPGFPPNQTSWMHPLGYPKGSGSGPASSPE
eukprot:scaffold30162_cov37-Prasinocladus_malaysianus.AAC.1